MENKDKIFVQQRLKERRLFMNMTYQDLADKTGLSKSTLQRYETGGIQNLPIDSIYKISEALGVNPNYFTSLDYNENLNEKYTFSQISRELYLKEKTQYVDNCFQILAPMLLRNNYTLMEQSPGSIGDLVAKRGNEIWYLDFKIFKDQGGENNRNSESMIRNRLYHFYGRLALYKKPITKYSIVVNNEDSFRAICKNPPVNIKTHTSVFLINEFRLDYKEHVFD